jgi:branched-chain amino acid transport system substrate-binding protein
VRVRLGRLGAAAVAVGLMLGGVAACGSSSHSASTGSSSSAGGGSTTAASGAPIVVGNIGSYSGALASSFAGSEQVIQAWAKTVNAAGGINGRQVKLIVKDDAGSTSQALTDARDLVENEHAVAIVGNFSNVDSAFAPYLKSKGIPVIGGIPIAITNLQYSNYFPSGTNQIALFYGMLQEAKKTGSKFALMYCAEAPTCAEAGSLLAGIGKPLGVSLVYNGKISASAIDYTAQCQAVKASGATSYYVGSASAVVLRVLAACKAQGVTATPISVDGSVTKAWAADAATDGVIATEADFPFADATIAGDQAYQTAIAKYAPNLGDENGPNAAYAWVSGKLFEQAVKAGGSGDVTTASVLKGLYSFKGETLGGIAPPLTYVQGKPTLVDCYFLEGIKGGKFTTPNGLTTACAPDADVAAVASKLG